MFGKPSQEVGNQPVADFLLFERDEVRAISKASIGGVRQVFRGATAEAARPDLTGFHIDE